MNPSNHLSPRPGILANVLLRSGFAVLSVFITSATQADVLDDSLRVRLNFDAAPVGDVIVDTSPGAAHPGTNNAATWVSNETGRQGIMSFDGVALNQITVTAAPDLNSSVGTIAFWLKSAGVTANPNAYAILFDRRTAGGEILFQEPSGRLANQAQQASGGGANSQTTAANVTDGTWHHVAYVYDQGASGFASVYVDGVVDTTAANTLAWSWVPDRQIEIGASHETWWSGFTGFLDDFRIYDRILTASEVADVAGLGTALQIIINAGGQPQDLTAAEKDTPWFSVKATVVNGDPAMLRYQWQKDGSDIAGATNATYSWTVALADSGKKFRVQLSCPGAPNVTSAQATLTVVPEMILIFSFDAAPVGDVVADTTPNATKHNGANLGATWAANEDGRTGVMNFDGITQNQITVASAPELNSVRGTIAFWMKSSAVTPTPNPYAALFDRRAQASDGLPTTGGDVIYQAPDGHLANQAQIAGTGANSQTTGASVTDGKWRHVAYLYDQRAGGSVSFYVDGVLDSTAANSQAWAWVPEEQIEIGDSHDSFWAGYTGFLDEFRVYNRVLAPAEIAQLAGIGPQPRIVVSRQPVSLVTGVNDTPAFAVTATVVNGDPTALCYQWQKDTADIANATNAAYSFVVTAADAGKKFRAQLSYPGATNVTTTEAALTVLPEFVVHFPFDAAPQGDVIVDTAPDSTAHIGVNLGASWVASEGTRTGVMSFDGDLPSQITVAATPDLDSMRGTIAFWVKSAQTTPLPNPYAILFDRRAMPADGAPVTGGDVLFQLPDGHISNQAEVTARARANESSSDASVTDNTWHHVAYVYDQTARGYVAFYLDGLLDGKRNNSQSWYWVPEQTIELGKSHDPWWSAYTGFFDDFRIYNRVLSPSEIAQLAGAVISPPTLSISTAAGKVTLSWSEPGFVLQEKSDLSNPGGWANVLGGDVSPVSINIGAVGAGFYRLSR